MAWIWTFTCGLGALVMACVLFARQHRHKKLTVQGMTPWYMTFLHASWFARLISLDEEALINQACKQTGLSDFGDDLDGSQVEWRTGFQVELASLVDEACLSMLGRFIVKDDMLKTLETRLKIVQLLKDQPAILERPVPRPIVIVGLPRTASTLLLHLLARDKRNRFLPLYEGMFPLPPTNGAKDARSSLVATVLQALDWVSPMLRKLHQCEAHEPEEDTTLLRHTFRLLQADYLFNIPSYMQWVRAQDHLPVMRFHKIILQILDEINPVSGTERWVLKDPAHLFTIEEILQVYPNACIVQTHRDPIDIVASNCALYASNRIVFSEMVDPDVVGAQSLEMWSTGVKKCMRTRKRLETTKKKHSKLDITTNTTTNTATNKNNNNDDDNNNNVTFTDVYFREAMADPLAAVLQIYSSFGLETPTEESILEMRAYVKSSKRESMSTQAHRPKLEDWGLTETRVKEAFSEYIQLHAGRL